MRRGRAGQAGGGAGRAEGPLRREANNIEWAKALEEAGVHVVYGLVGPEDPHQDALVVRDERRGLAALLPHRHRQLQPEDGAPVRGPRAAHLRPGDRRRPHPAVQPTSPATAATSRYRKLLVAPAHAAPRHRSSSSRTRATLRRGRPHRAEDEQPGRPRDDRRASTRARQAGVQIDLIVPGHLLPAPGGAGPVARTSGCASIVGRYLEHSRIYWFAHGGAEAAGSCYIGSADLMPRNLDRRGRGPGAHRATRTSRGPGRRGPRRSNLADDTLAWRPGPRRHLVAGAGGGGDRQPSPARGAGPLPTPPS